MHAKLNNNKRNRRKGVITKRKRVIFNNFLKYKESNPYYFDYTNFAFAFNHKKDIQLINFYFKRFCSKLIKKIFFAIYKIRMQFYKHELVR